MAFPGGFYSNPQQMEDYLFNPGVHPGIGEYDATSWTDHSQYNSGNVPGVDTGETRQQDAHGYAVIQGHHQPPFAGDQTYPQAPEGSFPQYGDYAHGLQPYNRPSEAAAHQYDTQPDEHGHTLATTHYAQPRQPPYAGNDYQALPTEHTQYGDHVPSPAEYNEHIHADFSDATNHAPNDVDFEEFTLANDFAGGNGQHPDDESWSDELDEMIFTSTFGERSQDDEPWSPEKKYDNRSEELKSHVDQLVNVFGTSEASRTDPNGSASNSLTSYPSSTDSVVENENDEWGKSSELTIRPKQYPWTSQTYQSDRSRNCFNRNTQRQMPGDTYMTGYQMDVHRPEQAAPFRDESRRDERLVPPRNDGLLSPHAWSAEPSSPVSSTTSDVLCCPSCSAKFKGAYRQGNWGRHNRLKHKDAQVKTYPCEDDNCDKVFFRRDARLKHYRKQHLHLVLGPAVAPGYLASYDEPNAEHGENFRASSQRDQDLRDIWTG